MLPRPGDLDRLAEIHCPTHILAGERDGLRSLEEARELEAGIAGSKLAIVEGAGHMLPREAPEGVADAITGWLAEPGRAAPGEVVRTPTGAMDGSLAP